MKATTRTRLGRTLAATTAVGMIAAGVLTASPANAGTKENVTDATFHWGISKEATSGAFFGGCNFPVAGKSGDAGGSEVWDGTKDYFDDVFKTEDGNVSIVRPGADGAADTPMTWDTKCQDADGTDVTTGNGKQTGYAVKITDGHGSVDADTDTGTIQWDGSFTIVFYGGMTYWTVSDPKLTVENGHGQLTGTFSGYGASMEDSGKWDKLPEREGVIADFANSTVDLTDTGFSALPDYAGVEITTSGAYGNQQKTGENWGAFPQSWVDYNDLTGQSSYWFSSGGSRDKYKPVAEVSADYTVAPAAFSGDTSFAVTGASEANGLQVAVTGKDYKNLPKTSLGTDAVGVYAALIPRTEDNEFTAKDVIGAAFSYWGAFPGNTNSTASWTAQVKAKAADLDKDTDYDVVVWAAHGNGTDDTVLYRKPLDLTADQRGALWPGSTQQPSPEPAEPTPEPSEPGEQPMTAATPVVSGTAQVGKTVKAKAGTWTKGAKLSYQWLRSGKAIKKATKSSYTAVAADKGKRLSVKVTGSKSGFKSASKTSKSTAKVRAGTISAGKVKVSGKAKVGKRVKAKVSSFKPGGLKYSYQWLVNGKKIKKATKSSYTIAKKYKGKKLSVKVTAKKSGYTSTSKTSAKTKKVKR